MKNTTECIKAEAEDTDGQASLIQRLAHDLRQPLSNIECIGYYLDMVLGDGEPELQRQCETLRRMVQQAHWLLEDASLSVSLRGAECGLVSVPAVLNKLDAELALHEQRSLELHMSEDVMVTAPALETASVCGHVVSFLRNVAHAEDPIRVTALAGDDVRLEFSADVAGEADELLPMVNPANGGGLGAYAAAARGQMAVGMDGRRMTLTFWLPRGE
ncbi:MAG TPA: hypothetical protein VGK29_20640 [Paludibaculum sp.]|jgi:signal transduction histidine kinase